MDAPRPSGEDPKPPAPGPSGPASPSLGEPVLVQSGTFLVDRERALKRLRDYQFQDPKTFLLPWARCAVLSKATAISARSTQNGLILRFDGEALAPERLKNPYSSLFEEEADGGERYRHLAVGILAALRLQPLLVTVASGAGSARRALNVFSLEEPETLAEEKSAETETELRVVWGESMLASLGLPAVGEVGSGALERLKAAAGMLRVPLVVDGAPVPTLAQGPLPSVSFEENGVRGTLTAHQPGTQSELHFYRQGVRVSSRSFEPRLYLSAHLDDDRFKLDASHGKVVDDGKLGWLEDLVARHSDELLLRVCREQTEQSAAFLRDSDSVSGLTGIPLRMRLSMAFSRSVSLPGAERLAKIEREAWLAAWLRGAAILRLDATMLNAYESHSPALRALWEAPVYVSVTGKPLSLLQLATEAVGRGRLLYSTPSIRYPDPWVFGFEPSRPVVWLHDPGDPCLRALFKGMLREWEYYDTLWELGRIAVRRVRG
ncbi:MAG: hypothetical protein HY553_01520 [Elusimicrobia bacterium]|nr:hypothetical protein [Elusimicrobiota bacterium]